jgi:hypothetical protein
MDFIHEGYCHTEECHNYGYLFDAPSIDGVVQSIVCGVCGIDFTEYCVLKEDN